MEVGRELICTPFFVKVVGVALQIEYRLDQKGPYKRGDVHDHDGAPCLVDLKSLTVYWDKENVGFPMNSAVTQWSKCCGYGARAGKEDTLLDDDVLVTIALARPRRPDGGARVMKRHLSDAPYHVEDKVRLVVTYGKFIEDVAAKAHSSALQAFQNRVNWGVPKSGETSSLPLKEVSEVAAVVSRELYDVVKAAQEVAPNTTRCGELVNKFYAEKNVATFQARRLPYDKGQDIVYDAEADTFIDQPEHAYYSGLVQGSAGEEQFEDCD